MAKNILVLGLDELNLVALQETPGLERYRFHPLLSVPELIRGDKIDVAELLERAGREMEAFSGRIDALIGFWDFPVSSMVPILCERFGLRGPPLEAVVRCEHKYWSRLEQCAVIDEYPRFALLTLDDPRPPAEVGFPMWLKPVKSASSELAFKVDGEAEFARAAAEIREGIDRVGTAFEYVLSLLRLPPEIAEAGGRTCLAEEAVTGEQATVEGYAFGGEVHVYGVVDSYLHAGIPSFQRYQYPSVLPQAVIDRMASISIRVIRRLGLEDATFNIEYFWNPETDALYLLEVNPRHSQSHAFLFEYVDGAPNHLRMVRMALGQDPALPKGAGPYATAASWFVRRFRDGVVRRVPTAEEIERVVREVPSAHVKIEVEPGQRLSELHGQDSYSYELGRVYVGADTDEELREKYERCLAALPFEFDE